MALTAARHDRQAGRGAVKRRQNHVRWLHRRCRERSVRAVQCSGDVRREAARQARFASRSSHWPSCDHQKSWHRGQNARPRLFETSAHAFASYLHCNNSRLTFTIVHSLHRQNDIIPKHHLWSSRVLPPPPSTRLLCLQAWLQIGLPRAAAFRQASLHVQRRRGRIFNHGSLFMCNAIIASVSA